MSKKRKEAETGHMLESAEGAPVVRYVNWIIVEMIQRKATSVELRQSGSLPPEFLKERSIGTMFPKITNRLKIMCGLNPVHYPQPVDGTIKVQFSSWALADFSVHFEDNGPDPWIRIAITKRESLPQPPDVQAEVLEPPEG